MKKIVYVMNVDWNWIKQRPHFIAERLAKKYQLKIVYQYRYGRAKLQKRRNKRLDLKPIYVIPKLSGIPRLSWINEKILAYKIKRVIRNENPDIVYVTYPTHVEMIPDDYKGKVIYDCMDNHSAFCTIKKKKEELEKKEKKLVNRADKVLVSSLYLLKEICERYCGNKDKFVLVRNAYDGELIQTKDFISKKKKFLMAYIGTISNWFDWKTINEVFDKMDNVELHLFGPIDENNMSNSENVIYHGTVEHSRLYEEIKDMDCLIMPFIVNDIIEAVDPVKIYEYINFDKNIIMSRYDEVERFEKFVYFYSNSDEFLEAIINIKNKKQIKYSEKERIDFLESNNWDNRIKQIENVLEN